MEGDIGRTFFHTSKAIKPLQYKGLLIVKQRLVDKIRKLIQEDTRWQVTLNLNF